MGSSHVAIFEKTKAIVSPILRQRKFISAYKVVSSELPSFIQSEKSRDMKEWNRNFMLIFMRFTEIVKTTQNTERILTVQRVPPMLSARPDCEGFTA